VQKGVAHVEEKLHPNTFTLKECLKINTPDFTGVTRCTPACAPSVGFIFAYFS
jgi:hypothetical protein